jgi:hypothetical protein
MYFSRIGAIMYKTTKIVANTYPEERTSVISQLNKIDITPKNRITMTLEKNAYLNLR